jgi:hypothetical protein
MAERIEVSFNSPQCGWMSVGFTSGDREFHTTTAQAPHSGALSEILRGLSYLLESSARRDEFKIDWSRNPEALDLIFRRDGDLLEFEVVEYPTDSRNADESEVVFVHRGEVAQFCEAFFKTFRQLYEDRETDEFEFNWRQPFPYDDFEKLSSRINR